MYRLARFKHKFPFEICHYFEWYYNYEGAEKSKKREAAEAEAILQLCVLHNCKIAELPLNAAEQENDLRLCRTEFAEAGVTDSNSFPQLRIIP